MIAWQKRFESRKNFPTGEMKDELLAKLEELSAKTNRSRNELINILLESAVDIVKIED